MRDGGRSTCLTVEVRLGRFRGVELQALPNALAQHMACRIGLHDFSHGLLDEMSQSREPISVRRPKVVCQVHTNHDAGG